MNRRGKILFIDAKNEIHLERSTAYLEGNHIENISTAYHDFSDQEGFSKVVEIKDVLSENKGNLSVQLYVKQINNNQEHELEHLLQSVKGQQLKINSSIDNLFSQLSGLGIKDEAKQE